jgi:hypothetical protein
MENKHHTGRGSRTNAAVAVCGARLRANQKHCVHEGTKDGTQRRSSPLHEAGDQQRAPNPPWQSGTYLGLRGLYLSCHR